MHRRGRRVYGEAARLWQEDQTGILAVGKTTAHLRQEEQIRPGAPSRELIRQTVSQFSGLFDPK